jgi:hypothetical protein
VLRSISTSSGRAPLAKRSIFSNPPHEEPWERSMRAHDPTAMRLNSPRDADDIEA